MASLSRGYFLSKSTSPTAFLYQTRTLLPLSRSSLPYHNSRRKYSTEYEEKERDEAKKNNISIDLSQENQENDLARQIPANPPARRTSYLRQRGSSTHASKLTDNKASKPQFSSKKRLKTITRNEREAFGGLLARLKAGQRNQSLEQESQKELKQDSSDSTSAHSTSNAENVTDLMTVFESILTNKGADLKQSKADRRLTEHKQGQRVAHQNDRQDEQADGLEGIRLSELGFPVSELATGVDPIVSVSEAINMIVERESKEIEAQLFRAVEEGKGDSGLWEACRQRIFSMIDHVGGGPASSPGNSDPSHDGPVEQPQTSVHSPGPLNIPASVPTGPVVAKLYPRLLLLAFRMLSTHFPESQIISQFRSAVKEHSHTSAFLGTSQFLYEELMTFYWRSCNDLPAVVAFLRDMDNAGLYPSRRVRRLLKDIVRQRDEAMKVHRQAGEDFFWNALPIHRAFEELAGPNGWIETINSRKQQRQNSTIPAFRI